MLALVYPGVTHRGEETLEQRAFNTDYLARRQFHKHLSSTSAIVLVADGRSGLHGMAVVFLRVNSDIARLYSIAVTHTARGRGVAKTLLAAAESAARARGAARMRLEVAQQNHAAIGLYERVGYRRFAERHAYYENGDHAWRYEKAL